jgi:hypothetical protein
LFWVERRAYGVCLGSSLVYRNAMRSTC